MFVIVVLVVVVLGVLVVVVITAVAPAVEECKSTFDSAVFHCLGL